MGKDELDSWANLAARVLTNAPGADHGSIAAALDALKTASPDGRSLLDAYAAGAPDPTAALAAACEAAGFTIVVSGFVGG